MAVAIPSIPEAQQAFHFSESQRSTLRTHYQNGVTSTSQTEKIAEIAAEIGATSEQVKASLFRGCWNWENIGINCYAFMHDFCAITKMAQINRPLIGWQMQTLYLTTD